MSIGARIRKVRKERKLTQKELAGKAGVSQQLINKLESDNARATGRIVEIAAALDVRPEWLSWGRGPVHREGASEETSPSEDTSAVRRAMLLDLDARLSALWNRLQKLQRGDRERLILEMEQRLDDLEQQRSQRVLLEEIHRRLETLTPDDEGRDPNL